MKNQPKPKAFTVNEPQGRIRVLFPGGFELYEMDKKGEYMLIDSGQMTPLTRVPLVPVYGQKIRVGLGGQASAP